MTRSRLAGMLCCATLLGPAGAGAQTLTGPDLVRELSGNTLTGYNGWLWFSEYHLPDGRVFGHNAGVPNEDACWKVRDDAVCYYYPREPFRTEFCWRFERAGQDGYKISPVDESRWGIGRLEPGNPREHTDHGRNWVCEALISRRPTPPSGRLDAMLAPRLRGSGSR